MRSLIIIAGQWWLLIAFTVLCEGFHCGGFHLPSQVLLALIIGGWLAMAAAVLSRMIIPDTSEGPDQL